MTSIEMDAREYLKWMAIHNYARTTITCRCRYLGYFVEFASAQGVDRSEDVTLELLDRLMAEITTWPLTWENGSGLVLW